MTAGAARLLLALGLVFGSLAAWALSPAEDCTSPDCPAAADVDEGSLLQRSQSRVGGQDLRAPLAVDAAGAKQESGAAAGAGADQASVNARISISSTGQFVRDGKEIVLMGANYVVKAQPYYPPVDIVRRNAESIAEQFTEMAFRAPAASDGSPRELVPFVRLGAVIEASMPFGPGEIDEAWAAQLDAVVKAFGEHGVYVVLDMHQDALSTTNGGNGFPFWMGKHFQDTARRNEAYVTTPKHPLKLVIPQQILDVLKLLGIQPPEVHLIDNVTDPWRAFSVDDDDSSRDPRFMNVGNPTVRLSNNDLAWSAGTIGLSQQVQNFAPRLYDSWKSPRDREAIFKPYVNHILHLCRVWENNTNVIAVEPFNEPPLGGLPSIRKAAVVRNKLFAFYNALMCALDAADVRAPLALEDIGGSVPGANPILAFYQNRQLNKHYLDKLNSWAERGQLILSVHYYFGIATLQSLEGQLDLARKEAAIWGKNVPVFLSEFFSNETQEIANTLAWTVNNGINIVAYWHYVDANYTGNPGWYIYPESVTKFGVDPVEQDFPVINWPAWEAYEQTVVDGTFWGAAITGSGGGQDEVFKHVPGAGQVHEPELLLAKSGAPASAGFS